MFSKSVCSFYCFLQFNAGFGQNFLVMPNHLEVVQNIPSKLWIRMWISLPIRLKILFNSFLNKTNRTLYYSFPGAQHQQQAPEVCSWMQFEKGNVVQVSAM